MERIKKLNLYQKAILIILAAMFAAFTIAYSIVTSRVGYSYKDAILIPQAQDGCTVYTGRVKGEKTAITVSADKSVTVAREDKTYGPYTVREDPSAMPEKLEIPLLMKGVEILEGDDIFFRGGVIEGTGDSYPILFDEDGGLYGFNVSYSDSYGIERDTEGNPIDKLAPTATEIMELAGKPQLTSKGDWSIYGLTVFISVLVVISILYVDELFRWNMSFQIRNADKEEPSEWETAGRYISWTAFTIGALVFYIAGLTI